MNILLRVIPLALFVINDTTRIYSGIQNLLIKKERNLNLFLLDRSNFVKIKT